MKAATLGAVALVAAAMWRIELEIHGWGGLDWIGYFHCAIPAGYVLFLGWVGRYAPVQSRPRKIWLLLALGITACAWFLVVNYAAYFRFVGGPVFLMLMMHFGEENVMLIHRMSVLAIPLTPFAFLLVLYCFGLRPGWRRITTSLFIYCLSFPVSIQMLDMIPPPGEADFLHAIKSGFVIPFLVVGLGVLVGTPLKTFDICKMGVEVSGAA
ncbi:MAG: hypothetical protein U1F77_17870 [Kiritimatiellia bacterium]